MKDFMNIKTGSVDTEENWTSEGHPPEERKWLEEVVTCPSCKGYVPPSDITEYNGEKMCEGCAENEDMLDQGDPHGKDWN